MIEVARKLDLIENKLMWRIEKNSEELKRCQDQIDSNKCEIESFHRRLKAEHHNERKENYSQFAEKKSKNLFTTNNEIQYVRPV